MRLKIANKFFLYIFLLSSSAFGQKYYCDYSKNIDSIASSTSSDACIYNKIYSYSSTDTLARQLIAKILNLISLPSNFAIEPCDGINTCRAFVFDNGIRYIFYDRDFIKKLTEIRGNDWRLLEVLSHELGHHLCGHTLISADPDRHRFSELQADRFAGAMMARMGADSSQALLSLRAVEHPLCEMEILESYPCFEKRKAAVLEGFESVDPVYRVHDFIITDDLDKIDISQMGNPVRDQGNDPSGVGFSVAYAIEYEIKKKFNYNVQISPRYIFSGAGGNQYGASLEKALKFVQNKGAVEEYVWPYRPGDFYNPVGIVKSDQAPNRYKIKSYKEIDINISSFINVLNEQKSIIAAIKVPEYLMNDVKGKWKLIDDNKQPVGSLTTICLVGYDNKNKLLKFKNSWGTSWGDNGYGYLRYKDFQKLIIAAFIIEM